MTFLRDTGRVLLVLLIYILGCLWTLACLIITMTSVCVEGWCVNFSKGRTGGCSEEECDILSKGINNFKTWNSDGWGELLSCIREEEPPHQEEGERTREMPELQYPQPVMFYPSYLPRE